MGSSNGSASACDRFGRWDQLRTATFDFFDTPLDLHRPGLLDLVILEKAGDQAIGKLCPLFGREFQRLSFNRFKFA